MNLNDDQRPERKATSRVRKTPAKRAAPAEITGTAHVVQRAQHVEATGTVTATWYFDALDEIAKRYFDAWPKERDALLQEHKAFGERLLREYGFADADELEAWISERAGKRTADELDAELRASRRQEQGDDAGIAANLQPALTIAAWLDDERGRWGGLLGRSLTAGLAPVALVREVLDTDEDALRKRPPVVVSWRPLSESDRFPHKGNIDPSHLFARALGHGGDCGADDMPGEIRAAFVALVEAIDSGGPEGENVRTAYHAFAPLFWNWYKREPAQAQLPAVLPLSGEALKLTSTQLERALLGFIYSAHDPQHAGLDVSSVGRIYHTLAEKGGSVEVSVRDWENEAAAAIAQRAFDELRTYDELTADVFLLHVAYWRQNRDAQGWAWLTAEAVLRERKIKPKTKIEGGKRYSSGYRADDLREIYHCVQQLERFWITTSQLEIYTEDRKGRRQPHLLNREGRALVVNERISQTRLDGTEPLIRGWRFQLYPQLGAVIADDRFATLSKRILAYDTAQRIPEKRIGRYLAFHFRIASAKGDTPIKRRVQLLVDDCRLTLDNARPQRALDRFEQALKRLQADGIIDGWDYVENGRRTKKPKLPPRRWLKDWLELVVELVPPDAGLAPQHVPALKG
jgi:hypothetical protein